MLPASGSSRSDERCPIQGFRLVVCPRLQRHNRQSVSEPVTQGSHHVALRFGGHNSSPTQSLRCSPVSLPLPQSGDLLCCPEYVHRSGIVSDLCGIVQSPTHGTRARRHTRTCAPVPRTPPSEFFHPQVLLGYSTPTVLDSVTFINSSHHGPARTRKACHNTILIEMMFTWNNESSLTTLRYCRVSFLTPGELKLSVD